MAATAPRRLDDRLLELSIRDAGRPGCADVRADLWLEAAKRRKDGDDDDLSIADAQAVAAVNFAEHEVDGVVAEITEVCEKLAAAGLVVELGKPCEPSFTARLHPPHFASLPVDALAGEPILTMAMARPRWLVDAGPMNLIRITLA